MDAKGGNERIHRFTNGDTSFAEQAIVFRTFERHFFSSCIEK
jgi:hypothetical protein